MPFIKSSPTKKSHGKLCCRLYQVMAALLFGIHLGSIGKHHDATNVNGLLVNLDIDNAVDMADMEQDATLKILPITSSEKCDDSTNANANANANANTNADNTPADDTPAVPRISAEPSKYNITLSATNVKEMTWPDWPAVAREGLFHPLVFKGDSFVHNIRNLVLAPADPTATTPTGKTVLDEFIDIYKNRPDKINLCGIRINHALALFVTVRHLQPALVVESGINAGLSTFIIRAAAPDAQIYALDPEEKAICHQGDRWIDTSGKTTYFTGKKFVDLADHDWRAMIAEGTMDPEKTLVFIDDHLNAVERLPALIKAGIRHVVVEDNYKNWRGATWADKHGCPKQAFNALNARPRYKDDRVEDGTWLFNNLIAYAEFPPLVPPIMAKASPEPRKKAGGFMVADDDNSDIVGPVLRPDLDDDDMKIFKSIAKALDLDPSMVERNSYMQFMNYNQICYMKLLPMPTHISAKL